MSTGQLINDYLAAWNAHDIHAVGRFLADDAVYFEASTGNLQHGREAAENNIIGVLIRAMPDLNRELRSPAVASGDAIAFEWTMTGTNTGTWNGVPATRQKLKLKGITLVRVRDGKIAYQADYYDTTALNRQMGW